MQGQDFLGMVFTVSHRAFPRHLLFCPKHGRYHPTTAELFLFMLTQLKTALHREGMDITPFPLTLDAG